MDQVDGKPRIVGYAAVFDSLSEDLGGFREIIRPGAFRSVLAGADVRLTVNHDPSLILGRTVNGSLRLVEDARGLRIEADPPDTSMARDYLALLGRGDLSAMSFRFYMFEDQTRGQRWTADASGAVLREISEFARLEDVAIVAYPAYRATEVSVRSLEDFRGSLKASEGWCISADCLLRLAESGD